MLSHTRVHLSITPTQIDHGFSNSQDQGDAKLHKQPKWQRRGHRGHLCRRPRPAQEPELPRRPHPSRLAAAQTKAR